MLYKPTQKQQKLNIISYKHEYTGWHKNSKPLPNYQKIVLNRIKACQWDQIYSIKQCNIICW